MLTEWPAAALPHLGAARPDAGAAISLHLENLVGHRGNHLVEFLLSFIFRRDQRAADHRVSRTSATALAGEAAGDLGRITGSPQPAGDGFCERAEGTLGTGTITGLCAGTESGRVSVGTFEAP